MPSSTAKRLEPRTAKGERTRAKLLAAAKLVFESDGFLNARISDIAKRAKVSYGAFYHYFDSKEEIFREVADAFEAELTAPPGDGERVAEPRTPQERITAANRRYLERYRKEAAIMGVIEQVSRYDAHVYAARAQRQKDFATRAEQAIAEWQAQGLVDPAIDPALAADALGAMVARFAELWLTQGYHDYQFDHAVEQLNRLWVNALGLRDSPPARRSRVAKKRTVARPARPRQKA